MHTSPTFVSRCANWTRAAFGIDTRSLAAFRIALGGVLLWNLIRRASDLAAMYTDSGIMPMNVWWELRETPAAWSLHGLSGSFWWVGVLFVIHGLLGLGILLGCRSRACCVGAWFLLVSLHHRNPLLVTGGDVYLGLLLFWGSLLPLDACWSWSKSAWKPDTQRFVSLATFGLIAQILCIYVVSGLSKINEIWLSGAAMDHVLHFELLVRPLGRALREVPWILLLLGYGTLVLEWLGPWLLLTTCWKSRLRCLAIAAFFVFHIGIELTMNVMIYSWVSMAGLFVFLPESFWQALRCPPQRSAEADMADDDTSPVRRWTQRISRGCVMALSVIGVVSMVTYNASYITTGEVPVWLENAASSVTWNQRWTMFSHPQASDERHVMPAQLASGEIVDVLRNGSEVNLDDATQLTTRLPSPRWTRLCTHLNFSANARYRDRAARYRMQTWNDTHDAEQQIDLLEYRILNVASSNPATGRFETIYSLQIDPFSEGDLLDGRPEGEWVFRHRNGNISSQGSFVAGLKQGKWTSYYPNGEPESEGLFYQNQPHGLWRYWDENGEEFTARYRYGQPISMDETSLTPE